MKIQHQLIEIVKSHLRVLEWVFTQLFAFRLLVVFSFADWCKSWIFFKFASNTTYFHSVWRYFVPDYFNCSRFVFLPSVKNLWKCDEQLFHLQSALDGNQMLFQLFAACSCDILILFMICLAGEIIIHTNDISNDVYHLDWYQFNATSKHIVRLMIARSQIPYYFASFKSLNCSLATFLNVWFAYHTSFFHTWSLTIQLEMFFSDYSKSWRCFGDASKHELNKHFLCVCKSIFDKKERFYQKHLVYNICTKLVKCVPSLERKMKFAAF